jgi:hypothetical protein
LSYVSKKNESSERILIYSSSLSLWPAFSLKGQCRLLAARTALDRNRLRKGTPFLHYHPGDRLFVLYIGLNPFYMDTCLNPQYIVRRGGDYIMVFIKDSRDTTMLNMSGLKTVKQHVMTFTARLDERKTFSVPHLYLTIQMAFS